MVKIDLWELLELLFHVVMFIGFIVIILGMGIIFFTLIFLGVKYSFIALGVINGIR